MADPARVEQRSYCELPEPVRLEDTIATQDPGSPRDPEGDQNPDRDFMLRYAG